MSDQAGVTGDVPATAITDSRVIRQQILDRAETSQQSQWIRAAYDLGHSDGAAAEREACARLAEQHRAIWYQRNPSGYLPFADLIRATNGGT